MAESKSKSRAKPTGSGKPEVGPMPMCPMAKTCKGMMEKRSLGLFLIIPGLLFIAVGLLIIYVPQALVWLMAAASILFGLALLMLANFMRNPRDLEARRGLALRGLRFSRPEVSPHLQTSPLISSTG